MHTATFTSEIRNYMSQLGLSGSLWNDISYKADVSLKGIINKTIHNLACMTIANARADTVLLEGPETMLTEAARHHDGFKADLIHLPPNCDRGVQIEVKVRKSAATQARTEAIEEAVRQHRGEICVIVFQKRDDNAVDFHVHGEMAVQIEAALEENLRLACSLIESTLAAILDICQSNNQDFSALMAEADRYLKIDLEGINVINPENKKIMEELDPSRWHEHDDESDWAKNAEEELSGKDEVEGKLLEASPEKFVILSEEMLKLEIPGEEYPEQNFQPMWISSGREPIYSEGKSDFECYDDLKNRMLDVSNGDLYRCGVVTSSRAVFNSVTNQFDLIDSPRVEVDLTQDFMRDLFKTNYNILMKKIHRSDFVVEADTYPKALNGILGLGTKTLKGGRPLVISREGRVENVRSIKGDSAQRRVIHPLLRERMVEMKEGCPYIVNPSAFKDTENIPTKRGNPTWFKGYWADLMGEMEFPGGPEYEFSEGPIYNAIDAVASRRRRALQQAYKGKKISQEIMLTSETFGKLSRTWHSQSHYATRTMITFEDKKRQRRGILGMLLRQPFHTKRTSAPVPMLVIWFVNKETAERKDAMYKNWTAMSFRMRDGKEIYILCRRHGITLLKSVAYCYSPRCMVMPFDTAAKIVQLFEATNDPRALEPESIDDYFYDGENWVEDSLFKVMLFQTVHQFCAITFSGSQLSSFMAESRRMMLARVAIRQGKCFTLRTPDNKTCRDKTQEAVLSCPVVMFLAEAWNKLLEEDLPVCTEVLDDDSRMHYTLI